jgi:hypothetical protein
MNEFEKADAEVGVMEPPPKMGSPNGSVSVMKPGETLPASDIIEFRETLLRKYYGGATRLKDKLKDEGRDDVETLLVSLIDEIIVETDNLLGNELLATHNGDLRDATVISVRRSDILEKAIRAVQAKMEFEKEAGIDVDSPSMMVVIRFFMEKAKEAFSQIGAEDEQSDLFFRTFGDIMEGWRKELRERFEELKTSRTSRE